MVLDWESAKYTKPDKPLNAYETLIRFYPEMSDNILPILKELNIDKENLKMDDEILLLAQNLDNISDDEILKELKDYLVLLFDNNKNYKLTKE